MWLQSKFLIPRCHGPKWLKEPKNSWIVDDSILTKTELETKTVKIVHCLLNNTIMSFSDFFPLKGFAVYYLRVSIILSTHPKYKTHACFTSNNISTKEVQKVLNRLTILYQEVFFPKKHWFFQQTKEISSSSTALTVSWTLLQLKLWWYAFYNPFRLLVRFVHKITPHGSYQLVLKIIRSKFRFLNCKSWILYKKRSKKQLMGLYVCIFVCFSLF